jgi:hypothetical protein
MRLLLSFLLINTLGFAQNLTEFGAVAIGSTVGGASGKPVSNGINAIFGKVDHQAANVAARETTTEKSSIEALKITPKAPQGDSSGVPLPPPPHQARRTAPVAVPVAQYVVPKEAIRFTTLADVAPAFPPPPMMAPEDLRNVASGMTRADVLKFGPPSAKITTFEDSHLVEFYSYYQNGQKFGGLKLTDGVVSSVQ